MKKTRFGKIFASMMILVSLCICTVFSVLASASGSDAKSEMQNKTTVLYEENFDGITERVDLVSGENSGAAEGWTFVKKSSNGAAYIENGKLHFSGSLYDVIYRTGES